MKNLLITLSTMFVFACAGEVPPNIVHINSLKSPGVGDGEFRGIEEIAKSGDGNVRVVYFHGMGWTENGAELADSGSKVVSREYLGDDFLMALEKAYPGRVSFDRTQSNCIDRTRSLKLTGPAQTFTLPGLNNLEPISISNFGCLDRVDVEIEDQFEMVLYRLFWDDAFWDSIENRFTGFDDTYGAPKEYFNRQEYNAKLKDVVVNFGFIDAVTYLSPVGEEMRATVRAAICLADMDANTNSIFEAGVERASTDNACENKLDEQSQSVSPTIFIAESMGSKVLFDVLQDAVHDKQEDRIDSILKSNSEIYLLANQIALLYPGLAKPVEPKVKIEPLTSLPKLISISEPNDLLTMEMVPFFREFWRTQPGIYAETKANILANPIEACVRNQNRVAPDSDEQVQAAACDNFPAFKGGGGWLGAWVESWLNGWVFAEISEQFDRKERNKLMQEIGFEPIDVRAIFAPPLKGLTKDLIDPMIAHSGHNESRLVFTLMLCGAASGQIDLAGCDAAESIQ